MFPVRMIMETVGGAFGGTSSTSAPAQAPAQKTVTRTQHGVSKTMPAPDKTGLYSWFKRKSGRRYNVMSSEAPVGALRGAVSEWGGR